MKWNDKEITTKIFGIKLKELREKNKLSQGEVGKVAGVSGAAISRWENGVQELKLEKAMMLANYFDVTVDYMTGLEFDDSTQTIIAEWNTLTDKEKQEVYRYILFVKGDKK